MPRKYTRITPEIIEKVKKYLADDRGFSKVEVARLVGISEHSLQRIVQGYYDQPVENKETQVADSNQDSKAKTITEIPYEQLEYLIKCECFISEMFAVAVASDKDEDELYFPRHYVNNMCDRYFPDRKAQKLRELYSL
jgi:hypothetical protein